MVLENQTSDGGGRQRRFSERRRLLSGDFNDLVPATFPPRLATTLTVLN